MTTPQENQALTEHERAMIAKANESDATVGIKGESVATADITATPEAPVESTKPEWCPDEFWNAETGVVDNEGLARKYAELTKPAEEKPAETPKEEAKSEETQVEAPFVAAVEAANKDIEASGTLSEETYQGFEKLGLSREHVDAYIEGQQAKAELTKMRVFGEAGSEEAFTSMFNWGVANYNETEREMFDKMMNSGNVEQAVAATKNLKARYEAAEGKAGNTVVPSQGGTSAVTGFTSKDEVVAAMSKPEYRTNAKYRADVQAKIDAALKAGTDLGF